MDEEDFEDLELMSVAEAIAAARAEGCSDASIAAATAALAAKEDRLHEGAYAAAYVYAFAKSYADGAAGLTARLHSFMTDAAVRGREALGLKTLRECDFDTYSAIWFMRHGKSPQPGSADRTGTRRPVCRRTSSCVCST